MLFSTTTQYPGPTTLITIHDLHHEPHLHTPIWERERERIKGHAKEKDEREKVIEGIELKRREREERDQTEMREEQEKTKMTVASL